MYSRRCLINSIKGQTMRDIRIPSILLAFFFLAACGTESTTETAGDEASTTPEFSVSDSGVKTKNVEGFGGVIAESYSDSQEWWAPYKEPKEDAPNVIIFLLDDVGFAQVGSFGALINTPNIDALAENGLRYNNFHTTALCSPSRATLMAGRNPHSIGLGSHAFDRDGLPRLQRDHARVGKVRGQLPAGRGLRQLRAR
jgi:arylsulfatase